MATLCAIQVLTEIANEEIVHAGEFLRLLHALAPEEAELYAQGAKEVEEKMKTTQGKPPAEAPAL